MPSTSNSELTKRLKVRLAKVPGPIGTSVKVVERPGAKIHLGIANNNPFKRKTCGRTSCPLMSHGLDWKNKCMTENIMYRADCTKCEDRQKALEVPATDRVNYSYYGETARTLHVRASQHMRDCKVAAKNHQKGNEAQDYKSIFI